MSIGLYFGSFNPIHNGHLIIANHILNEGVVGKVWFIVSPQNPLKVQHTLLNEYHRLHLVRIAIEDDNRMSASDIEFSLKRPSYTIDTLTYLKEKYPQEEFSIIMGSDSFQNIKKWKNYETIIQEFQIILYKRPGFDISGTLPENIQLMNAPLLEISATHIRETIKKEKSIRYLIPEKVREEIEASRFYRK